MKALATLRRSRPNGSIQSLARQHVVRYSQEKGWKKLEDIRLDIQEIHEMILYPEFEYSVVTTVPLGYLEDEKVLGKTIPEERVILIDPSIAPPNQDPRYVSTFGHEWGHGILHPDAPKAFRCSGKRIFAKESDEHSREIQANLYFEHLLMPDPLVKAQFYACYRPSAPFQYFRPGVYYLDTFGGNRRAMIHSYTELCRALAYPLTGYFSNVSRASLALKLHKLGLVVNHTRERIFEETTHIGYIMREMQRR